MISDLYPVFISFMPGDEIYKDYLEKYLKYASHKYVISYSAGSSDNEEQWKDIKRLIKGAKCFIQIWSGSELNSRFRDEMQYALEVRMKDREEKKDKGDEKPYNIVTASWGTNTHPPFYTEKFKRFGDADFQTIVEYNRTNQLADYINGVCINPSAQSQIESKEKNTFSEGYIPIDLTMRINLTLILRKLAQELEAQIALQDEKLHNKARRNVELRKKIYENGGVYDYLNTARSCLFWASPNKDELYMIAATDDSNDYGYEEIKLIINQNMPVAGEVLKAFRDTGSKEWVSYPNLHAMMKNAPDVRWLDENVQKIGYQIGPILAKPIVQVATEPGQKDELCGVLCIDAMWSRDWEEYEEADQPVQPADGLNQALDVVVQNLKDSSDIEKLIDQIIQDCLPYIPQRALSYRHYRNINSILRTARLYADLPVPIRAALYHVNKEADERIAKKDDLERGIPHIHLCSASPGTADIAADEKENASNAKIVNCWFRVRTENLVTMSTKDPKQNWQSQGLVGKVWSAEDYIIDDRSGLSDEDLKDKYDMNDHQIKLFKDLKSLAGFPIRNSANRVIGVLVISSPKSMRESKIDSFTADFLNLVPIIEKILNST